MNHPYEEIQQAFEHHPGLGSVQIIIKCLFDAAGDFDSMRVFEVILEDIGGVECSISSSTVNVKAQVKACAMDCDIHALQEDQRFEKDEDKDVGNIFLTLRRPDKKITWLN